MASNRPITYLEVLAMFAERGTARQALDMPFRANTVIRLASAYDQSMRFDIVLYGSRIASLYNDGTVFVTSNGRNTNTTKNRLNDVLLPAGWHLRSVNGVWKVFPFGGTRPLSYKSAPKDFVDAMTLEPVPGSKVHAQLNNNN